MNRLILLLSLVMAVVLCFNLVSAEEINLGFGDEKQATGEGKSIVDNIRSNWINILVILLLIIVLVLFLLKQMN